MSPDVSTWREVLDGLDDEPPALEVSDALASATAIAEADAYDHVTQAIDDGVLVEKGEGFGYVELGEEYRESDEEAKPDEGVAEEADISTSTPRVEAVEPGEDDADSGDVSKYRRIYLDAADRAGREPWEPVEEAAIREALDDEGFAQLLDRGDLFQINGWQVVDTSDDGEDPRRRWYYPSESEPRPDEFRRFHDLLTEEAPDGYEPFYFRVQKAGKAPATQFGSWKTEDARLSVEEAVEWMKAGGNVGVAGTPDDPLVNVDIDDDEATTPDDVPTSLRVRSRSRTGWHTWYFDLDDEIPNIPTDEYGEIRTDWQYVVAPGSFAASCSEDIPDDADHAGYYTLEDTEPVATVDYDDLPQVFHDVAESVEEVEEDDGPTDEGRDEPRQRTGGESAVFDVEASDLTTKSDASDRFTSIFHGSGTGANMSVSNDKLHCWRHGVAHGGLQALAVLSNKVKDGCRELGKAHQNSGAGRNKLKGDWRLIWAAWHEAKNRGEIANDDPIPYIALRGLAVEEGVVDRDDLVVRDADTGDVVEEPDEYDGDTYEAFPPGAYADALEHVEEEHDVDPGREVPEYDGGGEAGDDGEYRTDPRHVEATVDLRRAWDAAGRVTPDEVEGNLPTTDGGDAFASPGGEAVDVVRAVAIAEGLVDTAEEPLEDEYPQAYQLAREAYEAPLPEYYTTADAIAEFDAVLDLIGEVTFWDLDTDALESEITEEGDEVGGEAVRALNPSWRDSESEASVLVFDSGKVWDADTERGIDAQRFVALDSGLIDDPTDAVAGGDFTEAYRRLRDDYGAPLPRWDPATDSGRDITPQLPPSEELLDEGDLDGVDPDALEAAREEVEALIDDATTDAGDPTVVTALPATGKTTGTVKTARERPLSYLAPRKELQAQALRKADRWGVDAEICPVFSDERVREDVLAAAVSHVRDYGKSRLRDRWAILSAAFDDLEEDDEVPDVGDIFTEDDEDAEEVDLDRPTCETAEGKHGVAWALAVHTARRLGYTPREIHTQASGLFGAELPCSRGESDCEYTEGWDDVADADNPPDLLVGAYIHAHVESVRTKYDRAPDGTREKHTRGVVLDEFVGEAFTREFGPEALDFATWLATALRGDVADRRDMIDADLYGDEWVRSWLDGDGSDTPAVEEVVGTLARTGELYDARDEADAILGEVGADTLDELGLREPLEALVDGSDDPAAVFRDLRAAIGAVDPNHPRRGVARWADEEVAEPLGKATVEGASTPSLEAINTDAVPFGGDLEAIVSGAVEAARTGEDTAREAIAAATTALRGGREGCRRLAAWADDGYAHPDAHHLLRGVITPTDTESDDPGARRIHTDAWAFDPDATEGTVLDVVETTEKARTVVDRNDHGALLHTPPARTAGNGDEVPLVGLDATGRRELWANALGEDVTVADIHDTPAERAEFLLEALDLRVIQAADRPRYYSGDPTTKDTDGDAALLEAIADEYAGIDAPRQRGEAAETVGKPAAITTKGVRGVLEDDPRLDDVVDAWENYGNLTGANDLGNHRLAAVLGCQHYGDDAIERFCAIGGREVDTSREGGRGAALGYDDDLADAYLKHMSEDQTMQAILRFARGDSGATVVARTSTLREDLPVAGDAQVVETWSDTATAIAREWRRLGDEFTAADVRDAVDVGPRQVRRVLAELVDAGYLSRVSSGDGIASTYEPVAEPGSGEVDLPDRGDAVDATASPGRSPHNQYYTWNVRVSGVNERREGTPSRGAAPNARAPPAPTAVDGVEPPG